MPADPSGLTAQVRRFVLEESDRTDDRLDIGPETDLIGSGVLDSVGIFQVLARVELELGIVVCDDELLLRHFETLGTLTRLIASKLDR